MSIVVDTPLIQTTTASLLCPALPVTTVEVQPAYYSQYHAYPTVIDPFNNGSHWTIHAAPSTVVIECYITNTHQPGLGSTTTTTTSSSTSTSSSTTTASTAPLPTNCAVNSTTGITQADIVNAINQWRSDVLGVNAFLESVLGNNNTDLATIQQLVLKAYAIAIGEPCQFQILLNAIASSNLANDPQVQCAAKDLAAIFGTGVLDLLSEIIANPTQSVLTSVAKSINVNRCCRVLPDVQILFNKASSIFAGQTPQPSSLQVPIPNTCASLGVDCSQDPNASKC